MNKKAHERKGSVPAVATEVRLNTTHRRFRRGRDFMRLLDLHLSSGQRFLEVLHLLLEERDLLCKRELLCKRGLDLNRVHDVCVVGE